MPLVAAVRPRRCPAFTRDVRPATKASAIPQTRPGSEIVAVMRAARDGSHGRRLRGLIVVLWRAGLRITKRSRSAKPTSTRAVARCSSAVKAAAAGVPRAVPTSW
jgi:hypothetical protein